MRSVNFPNHSAKRQIQCAVIFQKLASKFDLFIFHRISETKTKTRRHEVERKHRPHPVTYCQVTLTVCFSREKGFAVVIFLDNLL